MMAWIQTPPTLTGLNAFPPTAVSILNPSTDCPLVTATVSGLLIT